MAAGVASARMGTKHYSNLRFLAICIGIFSRHPLPALSRVVRERPWAAALTLIAVLAVLFGMEQVWQETSNATNSDWWLTRRMYDPRIDDALILYPLVFVGWLAVLSGFYWVVSWILRGRGPYSGLFAGLGFAWLPSLIVLLFLGLPPVGSILSGLGILGMFGPGLFLLLLLASLVWSAALTGIVIQENYGFSSARASAVLFSPIIIPTFVLILSMGMLYVLLYFLRLFADAGWLSNEQINSIADSIFNVLSAL